MEYQEYIADLARVFYNLVNEQEYYKSMFVYFTLMLSIMEEDATEVAYLVSEVFDDLIKDSETETAIITMIIGNGKRITEELTEDYFEGSPEFQLYASMYKRINNSTKRRATDAYPVLLMFNNLINNHVTQKKKYYVPKREKYMSESEYEGYIEALKNKD